MCGSVDSSGNETLSVTPRRLSTGVHTDDCTGGSGDCLDRDDGVADCGRCARVGDGKLDDASTTVACLATTVECLPDRSAAGLSHTTECTSNGFSCNLRMGNVGLGNLAPE